MATIKSYTDLSQSKKLAEILPLESADMVLLHEEPYDTSDSRFDGLHQALCVQFSKYDKSWRQKYKNISYFPCWSLAALLGILPKEIEIEGQCYAPCLFSVQDKWLLKLWYNSNHVIISPIAIFDDNPVDACYEMIIRLNELKRL